MQFMALHGARALGSLAVAHHATPPCPPTQAEQTAARLGLEEAHLAEFSRFNVAWDARLAEHESRAAHLVDDMQARHASELESYRAKAASKTEQKPKFSKDLLNLRAIQATLAKQQEYAEAHKVKQKADALERRELGRMAEERALAREALEAKFVAKQRLEQRVLVKRAETGRGEQKRQRQADMERLLQRYANAKHALEKAQQAARARLERELKMTSWASKKAGGGSRGASSPVGRKKSTRQPTAGKTMSKVGSQVKPGLAAGRS